jgi:hypothetical protein
MRRKSLIRILAFAALGALLVGAKCPGIPDTHDAEITLVTEEFIELTFHAEGEINVDDDTYTIDIEDLREQLDDAGIDIGFVDEIRVSAVEYGAVTCDAGNPDRRILGEFVKISRGGGGPATDLILDFEEEVCPLMGLLVPAPIEEGGIDTLNVYMAELLTALKTFGSEYTVSGSFRGTSEPVSADTDFLWRVRIYYHVSGRFITTVPSF